MLWKVGTTVCVENLGSRWAFPVARLISLFVTRLSNDNIPFHQSLDFMVCLEFYGAAGAYVGCTCGALGRRILYIFSATRFLMNGNAYPSLYLQIPDH